MPDDSETNDGSPSKLPYDPFSCAMTSCPDLEGTKNWSVSRPMSSPLSSEAHLTVVSGQSPGLESLAR